MPAIRNEVTYKSWCPINHLWVRKLDKKIKPRLADIKDISSCRFIRSWGGGEVFGRLYFHKVIAILFS